MRNKNQSGFTLIELLVVVGIIAILASIVLLALNSARVKSRDAKRIGDIHQLDTALELYFNDMSGYPNDPTSLVPTYMGQTATAPTPADGSCTTTQNTYTYAGVGTTFLSPKDNLSVVYPSFNYTFCLGSTVQNIIAGPHTLSPQGIQ